MGRGRVTNMQVLPFSWTSLLVSSIHPSITSPYRRTGQAEQDKSPAILASKLHTRLLLLSFSCSSPQQSTQNLARLALGNNIQDLDSSPESLVVSDAFSDPFRDGFLDVPFLGPCRGKGDWWRQLIEYMYTKQLCGYAPYPLGTSVARESS
jgi:hypothetical protein